MANKALNTRINVSNNLSLSKGLQILIGELIGRSSAIIELNQEVPQGNGELVMCIQGLGGSWMDMEPLNIWLSLKGYRPVRPGIIWNVECPERTTRRLAQTICQVVEQSETPLCLVGYSLGGLLAKAIEASVPDGYVRGVFLLGSPLKQIRIHRLMDMAARGLGFANNLLLGTESGCFRGECDCQFVRAVKSSLRDEILYISLYTLDDQITEYEGCLLDEGPNIRNIKVEGTHSLLPSNPQVLLHIAELLPQVFSKNTGVTA